MSFCRMLFVAVAALLPGTGGTAQTALWTPRPMPYDTITSELPEPHFAFATDPVAETMGIPPLRGVKLRPGFEEVRIWIGFGVVIPHKLIRLTKTSEGVRGELVLWWDLMEYPIRDAALASFLADIHQSAACNQSNNGMRWTARGTNGESIEGRDWTFACRASFGNGSPDWEVFWGRLREIGALELPDPSTLSPEETIVLDGISIEVEVLQGERYHTYTYSNPDVQPRPEAKVATAVVDLARRLYLQVE